MAQSIQDSRDFSLSAESLVGRFKRYANGRVAHFWKRQILTAVGGAYLSLMASPMLGLLACSVALIGEVLDCLNLRHQLRALDRGKPFGKASFAATLSGTLQAISISICILIAWFAPSIGNGMHFALVFLMSASLNAGLVWPYHKSSAYARLCVFGMTFLGAVGHHFWTWDAGVKEYLSEVISMLLMCYIVSIILQFVVGNHSRQMRDAAKMIAASKALETSDKQKKKSQDEARRLSLVARYANDSIVISSPQGRITWVNEAFTRITGYTAEEAIGCRPAELLNDVETSEETTSAISNHIQRGVPIRTEVLNRRKDGNKIWVETNIVPIKTASDDVEIVVAIERDITALKEHERELAEAKILAEKGEKSKAEFLATMSHEIRTPMNGIMGLSDLLAEHDLPEDLHKYAVTIKESAGALLTIINDILDYSKLDAGQLLIDPIEFDLRACFSAVIELLAPQATAKGIFLDVEMDDKLPELVIGDDGRVRQILLNMIGNAIKFTSLGGVTIQPRVRENETEFLFSVGIKDTGIGIEKERIGQIFEKFQQADSKTTRRFGGTGLGLSISKQLVERMGGAISAQSELGVGSTFLLELQLGKPRRKGDAAKGIAKAHVEINPMSVLVAEDNKTNRFLISKYLQGLPLDVCFARDGREAVDSTLEIEPDLIFMDMSMPEMDGLEATRKIRERAHVRPYIIALTANAFASDREACFQAGMDDFLSKPVKKSDLHAKLSEFSALRQTNPL